MKCHSCGNDITSGYNEDGVVTCVPCSCELDWHKSMTAEFQQFELESVMHESLGDEEFNRRFDLAIQQ